MILKRATGSPEKNFVCKYCAHSKSWHRGETFCLVDECDCEVWDYGVNVREDDE